MQKGSAERFYVDHDKHGIYVRDRKQPAILREGNDPVAQVWDRDLAEQICAKLNQNDPQVTPRGEYR